MRVVIVGCGRVGSVLAESLDAAGHDVTIIDAVTRAFDRLTDSFKGSAVRGDGTDEDTLRRAGAEGADIFLALTEGDNRNVMTAQLASDRLGIPRVIAKINDPLRAAAYAELGVVTICRTNLMIDALARRLDLPIAVGPGIQGPSPSPGGQGATSLLGSAAQPAASPSPAGPAGGSSPFPSRQEA
ncbi:MAG TPA: TrkA family potassium uptake protein [Candidatus Limnocylindrales bacterium]